MPMKSRWADIAVLSQDEEEPIVPPPPVMNDSYGSRCDDSSKVGLCQRLKGAVALDSQPTSFAFLLDGSSNWKGSGEAEVSVQAGASKEAGSDGEPSEKQTAINEVHTAHLLNPDAPEFIPTLSMVCPLVCVSEALLSHHSSPQLLYSHRALSEDGTSSLNSFALSATSWRRSQRRKRTSSGVMTPVSNSGTVTPINKRPKALTVELSASKFSQIQGQLPDASEDDWQHRILKREGAVAVIKGGNEYQTFLEMSPKDMRGEKEPHTPRATDRSVSKRRWEFEVQQWRSQLKQWCVENACNSMLPTAELVVEPEPEVA